ncbi:D-3-phosphoglycerate dehydrogenase [Salmonella enterica subsp. arizonae]|uniref:D-3-phosphoglycerate dehydrogenase n=1 Tax=Salmonella enterica subsp. arizonae TaxID=59203 RepID=A0A379S1Y4_SALER|nr:D-3-phosphoglycerate dehydrogenase [Salmonella enterica subsp. arizonae]
MLWRRNIWRGPLSTSSRREPATNSDPFTSPLCEFDNVILTPHIGGSTQEAQENIGLEVAGKLIKYSDNGSTLSAVNFPEVSLPWHGGRRLMHIHENRPGVLTALNQIFADQGVNIAAQYLQTSARMGYVVIDIEADSDVAEKALLAMKGDTRHHSCPSGCTGYICPMALRLSGLNERVGRVKA